MKHYVFIDKKKLLSGDKKPSRIFGSIAKMCEYGIFINDKRINARQLSQLLGSERYFNNNDYFIKLSEIERKKMRK